MSDMFPIRNGLKQGDHLSPLLFNFALEHAISRFQVNKDGTHHFLVYANDNMLGRNTYTIKEKSRRFGRG